MWEMYTIIFNFIAKTECAYYICLIKWNAPSEGRFTIYLFICSLFINTLSVTQDYIVSNEEWMMKWEECGRKQSWPKALPRHFPGGTEETHEKNSVRIASLQAEVWTWGLPNTKQEC
jgi:hypothetical protein